MTETVSKDASSRGSLGLNTRLNNNARQLPIIYIWSTNRLLVVDIADCMLRMYEFAPSSKGYSTSKTKVARVQIQSSDIPTGMLHRLTGTVLDDEYLCCQVIVSSDYVRFFDSWLFFIQRQDFVHHSSSVNY
jgi:hypothetical protein